MNSPRRQRGKEEVAHPFVTSLGLQRDHRIDSRCTPAQAGNPVSPNSDLAHGRIAIPSPRSIERGKATVRDLRSDSTTSPNLMLPSAYTSPGWISLIRP